MPQVLEARPGVSVAECQAASAEMAAQIRLRPDVRAVDTQCVTLHERPVT